MNNIDKTLSKILGNKKGRKCIKCKEDMFPADNPGKVCFDCYMHPELDEDDEYL